MYTHPNLTVDACYVEGCYKAVQLQHPTLTCKQSPPSSNEADMHTLRELQILFL